MVHFYVWEKNELIWEKKNLCQKWNLILLEFFIIVVNNDLQKMRSDAQNFIWNFFFNEYHCTNKHLHLSIPTTLMVTLNDLINCILIT